MANEERQQPTQQQDRQSTTSRLVRKLFAKRNQGSDADQQPRSPEQGVAHIPSTLLTVEYLDDSEGMDAALTSLQERLQKVEEQIGAMQETQVRLVSAINQQAKDIGKIVESLARRIDRLYHRLSGGEAPPAGAAEERPQPEAAAPIPSDVADDPQHQNAWRTARVLAADLEAYHEEAVREGVLYGTFYSVLREPIEKARKAYEQRVSQEIVEGYDYFSKALDELIARKRVELEEEGEL